MHINKNNYTCPCKRKNCVRHGNCKDCKAYHRTHKKYPIACERIDRTYKKEYNKGTYIMAVQKVKQYFQTLGIENRIRELDVSSATVELAAEALNCEPCRIAKSISFTVDDKPILIVAAGDVKTDNKKYKEKFGVKAKMLSADETLSLIGHAVGGVCPFALNPDVTVYLDTSVKRFDTVFTACGSSNSVIELSIAELEKYSGFAEWIDVCKPKDSNI